MQHLSYFEESVIKLLTQYGYKAKPQVGVAGFFIDIGIKHPQREGEFILGIECDGASYHSAKSARDRDRLRQEILEARGWKIHRIWSTDWFKNRDSEINRLLGCIREIVGKEKIEVELDKEKKEKMNRKDWAVEEHSRGQVFEAEVIEMKKEEIITPKTNPEKPIFQDGRIVNCPICFCGVLY